MRIIKAGKWLSCGCCGEGFQTWEGYQDQDQDNGYGICKSCQGSINESNEKEFDKIINLIRESLNDENRAKMDAMTRDEQKAIAWQALDDGMVTYEVRRTH